MLIVSPVLSKVSGSVAGLVGSHNKGGMYFRQRSTPTNPNTSFQQVVRNAVKLYASRWSNTLTAAQRTAWGVYAQNQPLTNKLGESKNVPPLSQYQRSNVPRAQAGLTTVDAGPTNYTLPTFTDPSFTIVGTTGVVAVTFSNTAGTNDWAREVGGAMLVYISRPQSVGINFFKGPYRFMDKIAGAVVPPTSPAAMTSPFLGATGSQFFFRVRITRADGRLSADRFYSAIAT